MPDILGKKCPICNVYLMSFRIYKL